jgi:ABC-type sugar transport system substrate-binding protein
MALLLVGCSSTGSGGSSSGSDSNDGKVTYMADDGTCAAKPNKGVDFDAAKAYLKPFLTAPTSILPTEPLPKPIDSSTVVMYANNSTAVGDGLWRPYAEAAAKTAGVKFVNQVVGFSPADLTAGFNTILQNEPDILIMGAISAQLVADQVKQLKKDGVIIVDGADPDATKFGLDDSLGGQGGSETNGKVLAAGAIYFTCGTADTFSFYNTPELGFSAINYTAAQAYLKELDPNATLRSVDISIATTNADAVVADLKAHPETQFFISPVDQFQVGIASAAKVAGLTNAHGFGQSSIAPNIQQLKDGEQSAGFVLDFQAFIYQLFDEGFRKQQGAFKGYPKWETVNSTFSRLISPGTIGDVTIDANGNYIALSTEVQDYAKLWGK